ncbi:hypothetical protein E1A91_A01G040500v1 [Gossypium mustelinum]|uniref:Uncharacterized protein n=2 Tax=Gossypium TaxID=3633 RepID=A0A1U8IWX7_GOSHI|nr:uncharacterized protein LOC107899623 [Gossypium hirsutum]TYJ48156.1 hypothetical protein E1A91_A01G040500v1 [Gossypium mustelinum]
MAGLWSGKVKRVVIAFLLHESSFGGKIGGLAFFRYFWLAWSSLVLTLKAKNVNRMSKFTVLRDLNFVVENLGVEFFIGGVETLRPALQRLYMTRAYAYRDALKSFIEGYQEGIQQIMEKKEDSSKAQQEGNTDKNST